MGFLLQLKELSIYINDPEKSLESLYNSVIIYDYLTDVYYATKINRKNSHQRYKLGILNDTDPQHLSNLTKQFVSLFDRFS